ncbi:MAG: helix-turn-helix transcriptional regulator [Egibacteraceae bacterium]
MKLSRESLELTQEDLADDLGVDKNTIQGWETGRRALTSTRVNTYIRVRNRLRALGASPQLLVALDLATEADHFLAHVISAEPDDVQPDNHPLATWVVTRQLSEMLAWPFTKNTPPCLGSVQNVRRRGPVVSSPNLSREGQERFFDHLKVLGENASSPRASSSAAVLLRRQTYYCLSWDRAPSTRAWLADMRRAEHGRIGVRRGWSPLWVALRSLFVARARQGDKEPLRHFIACSMTGDDTCESANLNYWIYWIGESRIAEHSDAFMVKDLHCSAGLTLFRRLEENLRSGELLLDLYVHSIWALLQRRARFACL